MSLFSLEKHLTARFRAGLADRRILFIALLALCSAYIQGPLTKIFDFPGAIAESASARRRLQSGTARAGGPPSQGHRPLR